MIRTKIELYKHQSDELQATENYNRVAFYHDMGTGKSFTGSIKVKQLNGNVNIIISQKSMLPMWLNHFRSYEDFDEFGVYDLTNKIELENFIKSKDKRIGIINYDLIYRRSLLLKMNYDTMLLDESSLIQNGKTKRSKAIMKIKHENLVLLSGTPCSGDYSKLWTQLSLLGWKIKEDLFWKQYVDFHYETNQGFPIKVIDGYKNVPRLKDKMREYGCRFLKTNEVFDLPQQLFNTITVDSSKEYVKFRKNKIVSIGDIEFVGDTVLTQLLYERMLCGAYNKNKLETLNDLLQSTNDRLIIFYNFNCELDNIKKLCLELDKPISIVNGNEKDLTSFEECENSVTIIQYTAGSHGLNLQKANKIIYFTPPLSSELFEQSKKRTSRIGQTKTCFYYLLTVKGSIEEKIYRTLEKKMDYTNELFKKEN